MIPGKGGANGEQTTQNATNTDIKGHSFPGMGPGDIFKEIVTHRRNSYLLITHCCVTSCPKCSGLKQTFSHTVSEAQDSGSGQQCGSGFGIP